MKQLTIYLDDWEMKQIEKLNQISEKIFDDLTKATSEDWEEYNALRNTVAMILLIEYNRDNTRVIKT